MVLSLRTSVDLPSAAGVSMLCIAARTFGVRVEMVRSIIAFDALSMMTVIIGFGRCCPSSSTIKISRRNVSITTDFSSFATPQD